MGYRKDLKGKTIKWRLNNCFSIDEIFSNKNYSINHRVKL